MNSHHGEELGIGNEIAGGEGVLVTDELVLDSRGRARSGRVVAERLLPPTIVFLLVLLAWEKGVQALGIPDYQLPAPSRIWHTFWSVRDTVLTYGWFTFWYEALRGYLIGSVIGFGLAVLAWRFRVLARGLIPYAVVSNSVPIVAMAPIAVVLFNSDWQSKAFICAVMCVFPLLVNAYRGLTSVDPLSSDLMRSYGVGQWSMFRKLLLPASLPYVFNGLKINTTLAMIGAIVGEYFGSPAQGLGSYINNAAGVNSYPEVWAGVVVACGFGIAFYGVVLFLERAFTSWHISYRSGR